MSLLAVTVVGHDRPGIVAEVTAAIADLGGNLEDSSMSLLRGHFAMTLVADLPVAAADLQQRLAPLTADGLAVSVLSLPAETAAEPGVLAQLSVHGADRPGIVSTAAAIWRILICSAICLGRGLFVGGQPETALSKWRRRKDARG